ncbi:E3 ubiquitin-protein ligase TRIM69-like [Engraulis encrasicolus]|uniref:E3 ubiquitin-protein ligase TRIM69-like n=1 Tax=Engraulis encrasicolus TaxID=184585 RepID=UPI002FD56D7E
MNGTVTFGGDDKQTPQQEQRWKVVGKRKYGAYHRGGRAWPREAGEQADGNAVDGAAKTLKDHQSNFVTKKAHIKLFYNSKIKTFLQGAFHISKVGKKQVESLDESKALIRDLAGQLGRVSQNGETLLSSLEGDSYSLEECRLFILQWAKELNNLSQLCGAPDVCESWEQYEEKKETHPEEADRRLKAAQKLLSSWATQLDTQPQDSVHPSEDVRVVLEDLGRQWKRGHLANMLPAMDFIMWSVLQDTSTQGDIPQLWLKTKQRFKSRGAVEHIPDTVWNFFHESSVDVSLDPDTAHPDFSMSPDKKRVRVKNFEENLQNPRWDDCRSPRKFDGWWCVQGSQGFSSGRAYWEVGVAGKQDWRVGVVRESAPKNGFIDLNTQSGYCTLRFQRGELRALSVPARDLPLPHPLTKLGVYLDMEEGQVSFYDAVKRRHIYTFNETFTEKMYPVFGTVETDMELVIL